jgi:ubiquinone/menaquinone biosynthesis C-methylase UbiE
MDDANKLIQQQFGAHASHYATSDVHAKGESLQRLVELTKPQREWIVLDVSTGAGHTALTFAPYVARVIASDLTPQMLDTARKLATDRGITNIEFKPADGHALPFEDNTFDLVTNRLALHHFTDARKGIAEMARVCKPGGIVALVDNIVPPDKVTAGAINHIEKLRDPSHNWAYPFARLEAMFTDAHLKVEHSESFKKELEFEPWADRMSVSAEMKIKLRQLFTTLASDAVREFFVPRAEGEKLFFSLTEAIIIARKG